MKIRNKWGKGVFVVTGAWISNKFGLLIPIICLLIILMIIDYIAGMLASKKEALENPRSKKYGWNSKKGILGIYKKVGYMLTIFTAFCMDYLIYKFAEQIGLRYKANTIFGLLVSIWFVIIELISILENAGRMGAELPDFFKKVLTDSKKDLNGKRE